MGLPSFDSGDRRRVRVTSQNKRSKKNTEQVHKTKFRTYGTLARRTPLSRSLARSPLVATSSRAGSPPCSSLVLKRPVSSPARIEVLMLKLSLPALSQTTTPNPLPSLTGANPRTIINGKVMYKVKVHVDNFRIGTAFEPMTTLWTMTTQADRLWKIRKIFDTLNSKFCELYNPTEHRAVDKVIVLYKGRAVFQQYIPKKHIKGLASNLQTLQLSWLHLWYERVFRQTTATCPSSNISNGQNGATSDLKSWRTGPKKLSWTIISPRLLCLMICSNGKSVHVEQFAMTGMECHEILDQNL